MLSAGSSKPKATKLVIKPLRSKPRLPENFEAETWQKLQAAVHAVHAKRTVDHSLEELYRAVEDMCLQSLAASVYDRLRAVCEQHIEARLEALLGQTPDTHAFLGLVQACWADHCEQMLTLRSIFLYLDRTYVMQVPSRRRMPPHAPPPSCAGLLCGPVVQQSCALRLHCTVGAAAQRPRRRADVLPAPMHALPLVPSRWGDSALSPPTLPRQH